MTIPINAVIYKNYKRFDKRIVGAPDQIIFQYQNLRDKNCCCSVFCSIVTKCQHKT